MTKEKMFLVISFMLNAIIGLCIYTVKLEIASVHNEIAWTREILEEKIKNSKLAKLTGPKTKQFPETNPFNKTGEIKE